MVEQLIDEAGGDIARAEAGIEGNERLTAATGAVLVVLLAAEGVTILSVRDLLSPHVFIGMVVAALAVTKLASVGYRFARYYLGDPAYIRKGAPNVVLRVDGPIVVLTTIAVLATGIGGLAAGRSARWLIDLHKASFILWFVAMTVHVVGHVVDTPRLAAADYRPERDAAAVAGGWLRRLATVSTLATGLVLGYVAVNSGWMDGWRHLAER
jgi:hypothetical protein